MKICEPCDLREAGDSERADSLESIRSQRIVLAILNGAGDVVETIGSELHGCRDCLARLASFGLGNYAGVLAQVAGSTEEAAKWIEHGLLEDLDGQQG